MFVFYLGAGRVRYVVKGIRFLVVRVLSKVVMVTTIAFIFLLTVIIISGEGTRVRPYVIIVKILIILNYFRFLFNPAGVLRVK